MTILIIGAMDREIDALSASFGAHPDEKGILTASAGGKSIVIAASGIGKVNAAITTQRLIDLYSPDYIINTGIAGGIASDITICETVIASKLTYHDFHPLELFDRYPPYSTFFPCDDKLISLAEKACESFDIKHRVGIVVSGDCFVNGNELKADIYERFSAACTEMEGAAIAHTCMINKVPFAVICTISDFADDNAQIVNDFEKTAAATAAKITEYIINNI